MSALKILDNVKSCAIYKLRYNNKIVGLRVKHYDIIGNKFDYYDFELGTVGSNKDMKDFINSIHSSLESIDLIDYNNVLASKKEIAGLVSVQEFKDTNSALKVLSSVRCLYERK